MAQILKPEKRAAILKAAKARFRKQGIKETSMSEIAEDAGIAVGNLYRYFANKLEVVAACAEEFAYKHRKSMQEIADSDLDWYEKLKAYVVMRFHASQEVRTSSNFAAEIARAVIEAKPDRLADETELFMSFVKTALDEGIKQKAVTVDDVDLEVRIFSYAMAFFFPVSGNVVAVEPSERELLITLDWFRKKWTKL